MATPSLREAFEQMSASEQIELVQELWDRIATHPEDVPVPPSHLAEVRRRLAEHRKSPDDVTSWEELEASLRSDD